MPVALYAFFSTLLLISKTSRGWTSTLFPIGSFYCSPTLSTNLLLWSLRHPYISIVKMRFLIPTILATLALSGNGVNAHMILANPKPFSPDTLTNSPLSSSGSNYPCQVSGSASSFYSTSGISNTVTAGDSLSMSFKGSAVHGGGSCQVALSTDTQPSQSTRWSVILSIEGGCPTKDGTSASTYDVKIPSNIPAGTYSYAWTWTSKESGTQEYYMNCAPLTVKSSSKRRISMLAERDSVMDSFPPLAVYNMADLNSCKSELSSSPIYSYPGSNVEKLGQSPAYANITGANCFAKGVSFTGSSSSDSSGSTSSTTSGTTSASTAGENGVDGIDSTVSAAGSAAITPSALLISVVPLIATAVVYFCNL